MGLGNREGQILDEWRLETGQAVASVNELAKSIRSEAAHEKKLALIRTELDKKSKDVQASTDKLTRSMGEQNKSFTTASVKGNLYAAAIAAVARATKSAIQDGLNWEDWIGKTGASLDGASNAVAGMIDKLELQGVKMRVTAGDFQASERQIEALGKAAVVGGRIMRQDFGATLKQLTEEIVAGGEGTVFRRLGVDVQLLGTKSEKTAKALKIIEERFGATNITVDNTNEAVAAASAAWKNLTAEFVSAAVAGGALKGVLEGLTEFLKAGQGKGVVTDADLVGAFKKSPYKTWEAEQIARGSASAGAGLSGAISDRETARMLAQQKAMLKLIRGGKKSGTKKQAEGMTFGEESPTGLAGFEGLGMRTQFDLIGGQQFEAGGMSSAADAIDAITLASREGIPALQKWGNAVWEAMDKVKDMGVNALGSFAGAMWDVADAAIMGSESFGMAMAKMVKSTLLGVAQQATVLAVFSLAKAASNWWNGVGAAKELEAAALYGAVAAIAGGAGLGVSAGIKSGGGYDTKKEEKKKEATRSQSFGTKKDLSPTFYINLYMQPSKNGAAQFIGNQQFVAQLGGLKAA